MNWYEQKTNEYESLVGKQLLNSKGKAAWYGAYIIVKQVIAQNMNDDMNEWGYVPTTETITTLAEKCGLSIDDFRLFIQFCDERFIFEKKSGRLFCPSLLEEKNNYAKKVARKNSTDTPKKEVSTYSTDTTYKADKYAQYDDTDTITTQPQTQIHTKEKDKKEKSSALKALGAERGMSTTPRLHSHLEDLKESDFQEIAEQYQVPESFVLSKLDDMQNWLAKTGKKYKNYKAALRDWVKRDGMQRKEDHAKKSSIVYAGNTL